MQTIPEVRSDTTTVRIQVPARRDQLALVRALADAVSVDAEFAAEDIADIRLALNEVTSALVVDAVPGSMIDCEFTYDSRRLTVEVTSSAYANEGVEDRDFAWQIVRSLTTTASAHQQPFDITVSGYPTHVEFDVERDAPRDALEEAEPIAWNRPIDSADARHLRIVHHGGDDRLPDRPRHGGSQPATVRWQDAVARATPTPEVDDGSHMTVSHTDPLGGFVHPALFYDGDEQYVAGLLPFILDGLTLGEPVAVAAPRGRLEVLRAALGSSAQDVRMIDMEKAGRNPGRIIPGVLRAFADDHPDSHVRIIGEPIWPGRSALEYPACVQHEALINHAFQGRDVTIVCPYDVAGLGEDAIADAYASHPTLWEGGHRHDSVGYDPDAVIERYNTPVPEPDDAVQMTVAESSDMGVARKWATEHALRLGLDQERMADLELIVTELATNSLCHGVGPCRVRLWTDAAQLVCEVHDSGQMSDPLAGRRPAAAGVPGGRGLLLVHQLSDLVRTHTSREGTTLYSFMATAA